MNDLVIPGEVLERAEMSGEDLLIEIAVYLYEKERLSIGQAKDLAGMDLVSFQKELAKRDVYLHFDIEDYYSDLENLDKMDQ
jgi:predicted HTH domain antitoxin